MFPKFFEFSIPPETETGGAIESGKLSIDDMIDSLGESDEKPEDLLTKEKPTESEKKDKELEEEEEDEKEDDEKEIELEGEEEEKPEDEELDNFEDVPRKEILKAYPDLFKKFPQLERAYYREQRYAELLPTIEDAKEAVEKAESFDKFSNSVMNGDINPILNGLKTSNPDAFGKTVDNYLVTLGKIDKDAYYHVIGNIGKNIISNMVSEGQKLDNDQLKAAAVVLNQFLFGSSEYHPPTNFGKNSSNNEETQKLQSERSQFVQEKFQSSLDDVSTKTNNVIKSTISTHIDPKNVMTDYVKRTAIKDAVEDVDKLIATDNRFKATLDKLWEKAFEKNFSRDSMETIKKAYLNKARTLLPSVIQKHRNEALKGLGKRITDDREEPKEKGLAARGAPASAHNRGNKAAEIPRGMKTLDFLMQD